MKATMKFAAAAMAVSLLVGCAPGGPLNQTATEPTPTPPPTRNEEPISPASVVAGDKDQILQEIERYRDGLCLNHPTSDDCIASLQALNRMTKTLMLKLDALKPWSYDIAELAERTARELAAVAVISPDFVSASQIDTALVLLRQSLRDWSSETADSGKSA